MRVAPQSFGGGPRRAEEVECAGAGRRCFIKPLDVRDIGMPLGGAYVHEIFIAKMFMCFIFSLLKEKRPVGQKMLGAI